MRTLHVIPSLDAGHGGPSHAIRLMWSALHLQGVEVEIASTAGAGGVTSPCVDSVCHVFRRWINFYKIAPAFPGWLLRNIRHYDLIHIHALFSFTSVVAAWIARAKGVPYVIRPLGVLNTYGMSSRRPWLKSLSLALIEGPILRHADAVHFTSVAELNEAQMLGIPMRSSVVPLGVEVTQDADSELMLSTFPMLKDRSVVLYLSRLDPVKNLEGLLDAWQLVARSLPDVKLVIAGDGEPAYVAELKRKASASELPVQIIWAGFLTGELKASAFAAADLFVLPSFSENFGIAVAEALAAGLPCVVSEGVAIASAIEEYGAGVSVAPDAKSIADGLLGYLYSAELRARSAVAARNLVREKFSHEEMGLRLVELYEQLLKHQELV